MEHWIKLALELGFSYAVPVNPAALMPRQDVRDMCADDKCRAYGKNWTCPPYCGSLKECARRMHTYRSGILLQTVGTMEKAIDSGAYRRTEEKHMELFYRFCESLREVCPDALCLGSGGCRLCRVCAYPEPCRFPEKACSSMEGYGLLVTQVCRDNGLAYYHGERTITYTACVLFSSVETAADS